MAVMFEIGGKSCESSEWSQTSSTPWQMHSPPNDSEYHMQHGCKSLVKGLQANGRMVAQVEGSHLSHFWAARLQQKTFTSALVADPDSRSMTSHFLAEAPEGQPM